MTRPLTLILPLLLAACASGTNPQYRVQTASPTNITILTDPALRSISAVRRVAQAHCAQYGKQAVQLGVGKLRGGLAPVSFACR